jgi:hypothetical protein
MPPHSSHLLQPLNIGYFAPYKRAYGQQIDALARSYINHVTKLEFLQAFKAAVQAPMTKGNICASFEAIGLVPSNPDAILSKFKLRTPSPLLPTVEWQAKTPKNTIEVDAQTTLLRNRILNHQNSSPTSMVKQLDQLRQGT